MSAGQITKAENYTLVDDVPYGAARLGHEKITLHTALYLPKDAKTPPPLFFWFHAGAFKFGSYKQKICNRLGRRLTREGIAVAAVQYRLRAEDADLSDQLRARQDAFQEMKGRLIRPGLCQARSLAALEDGLRFIDWAARNGGQYGWSDKRIAGGASAGAITALNLAFSPAALGFGQPVIDGVYATSGGYNYPALVEGNAHVRILAQHSPLDDRVSIEGVRMLKCKLGARMDLLESDPMIHGHLDLTPEEKPVVTFRRIADFVHGVCAG